MYNLSTASSRRRCFVCALDFDGRRRRRFHERVEVHVVDIHLVDGFLRVGGIRRRRCRAQARADGVTPFHPRSVLAQLKERQELRCGGAVA